MNTFWSNEDIQQIENSRIASTLSKTQKRLLGLEKSNTSMVETLDELRESPPNIVIAKCLKKTGFIQNNFKNQVIQKKVDYVMSLGIYQQLVTDKRSGAKVLKPSNIRFHNLYRPYTGQDLSEKTLLVWRTGGIGDLGFIQPNLIHLKEKYPDCKIWFACGPQYQAMVDNWDCVDLLLDLPYSIKYLNNADYHVLFEGVIERCFEAHKENAYRLFTKWMGVNLPDEKLVPINKVKEEKLEKCLEVISDWNINPKEFILIQLRASSPIRSPSPEVWRKVTNALTGRGHKVIITDAPHASNMVEEFMKNIANPDMVFNFAPHSTTLDYTIALISLAKIVVATDSALMHLAASLNIPAVGIYGPFPGEIRLTTYRNVDWTNCKAPCAPCFLHGSKPCPNSRDNHSMCYENLDINELIYKIENVLEGVNSDKNNVDCQKSSCDNQEVYSGY